MTQALDELYLPWLYQQFADPDTPHGTRTFWKLARQMYTKEFTWFVPNDDNRIADGLDLRHEFLEEMDLHDPDPEWLDLNCSMLELMVGLSRRLSFVGDGEAADWFWQLIDNLGLRFPDRRTYPDRFIGEVLDNVVRRNYDPDGNGGFFPLNHPDRDQTKVEIWHQLHAYLRER